MIHVRLAGGDETMRFQNALLWAYFGVGLQTRYLFTLDARRLLGLP